GGGEEERGAGGARRHGETSSEGGGELGADAERAAGHVVDAGQRAARLRAVEPARVVVLGLAPAGAQGVVDRQRQLEAAEPARGDEVDHAGGAGGGAVG